MLERFKKYAKKLFQYGSIVSDLHSKELCDGQGMVWNGMENGMERKFRYGIWKMPEWNGMEDFKNAMEDNIPYFRTNSILDFAHGIYTKIFANSDT